MPFKKREDDADSGIKVSSKNSNKQETASGKEPQRVARTRINSNVNSTEQGEAKQEQTPAEPSRRERIPGKKTGNTKTEKSVKNKNLLALVIGGMLVTVVIVIFVARTGNNTESDINTPTQEVPTVQSTTLSESDRLKKEMEEAGYGIASGPGAGSNGQISVSSDTMLKDINGNSLPEFWEVKAITYINDIVFYTKHRAVTGVGVELYWLEGNYKGESCRIVVPYSYFREFPEEGGIVCRIEIVETTTGQKIFTWFAYDDAAHKKLTGK